MSILLNMNYRFHQRYKSWMDGDTFCFVANKGENGWFMHFGGYIDGYVDTIWFAEYEADDTNYIWKEFPLKLPSAAPTKCVVVFGIVVILFLRFNYETWESYVLDLGSDKDDYKWVQSRLSKEEHPAGADVIVTRSNELHFIKAWPTERVHTKIHLKEVLPLDIYKKYAK